MSLWQEERCFCWELPGAVSPQGQGVYKQHHSATNIIFTKPAHLWLFFPSNCFHRISAFDNKNLMFSSSIWKTNTFQANDVDGSMAWIGNSSQCLDSACRVSLTSLCLASVFPHGEPEGPVLCFILLSWKFFWCCFTVEMMTFRGGQSHLWSQLPYPLWRCSGVPGSWINQGLLNWTATTFLTYVWRKKKRQNKTPIPNWKIYIWKVNLKVFQWDKQEPSYKYQCFRSGSFTVHVLAESQRRQIQFVHNCPM